MVVCITALDMCSLCFDKSEVKFLTAAGQTHSTNWPGPIHGMWTSWSLEFLFCTRKTLGFFSHKVHYKKFKLSNNERIDLHVPRFVLFMPTRSLMSTVE